MVGNIEQYRAKQGTACP